MKATGIVRRIDDLGRIVIPKEIRRTQRIRESDPMEIFVDKDGQIILKKFSPLGEMARFSKGYVESLANISGHAAAIVDRENFVATAGGLKGLAGKKYSKQLDEKLQKREVMVVKQGDIGFPNLSDESKIDVKQLALAPIINDGDIVGGVLILSNNAKDPEFGEVEKKLVLAGAGFLGRQLD
jgi:AbrB family transcriptional regulator (stage V sporulation protein T)